MTDGVATALPPGAAIRRWLRPEPLVAVALAATAAIHALVVSEHYRHWALAGAFFLVLEVVELSLAIAALAWWRPVVARAVVVTSLGTVAVWAVSRTTGMPFGPEDFRHPEQIGVPDLVCGVLELAAAAWAFGGWPRVTSRDRIPPRMTPRDPA